MIPRLIEKPILKSVFGLNKAVLILGARQVGKTTLLKKIEGSISQKNKKCLYLNCDLEEDRLAVDTTSYSKLEKLTQGVDFLLIDEIQRLDTPGLTLKIIFDNFKKTKIIATGSSSFELKNKLTETLAGRYVDFTLYPFSLSEAIKTLSLSSNKEIRQNQVNSLLEEILVFGLYPEIYLEKKPENKIIFLQKIVESYLFKDILAFEKIRHPQTIQNLTRALAYQIGAEVNENELANRLKVDRKTILRYLEILEKSFVIVRLFPFSKNPRREIGRRYKIYFIDIGIRNALIGDFNRFELRHDFGAIWENFLIIERFKKLANQGKKPEVYFWRSYGGAEIDYLEKDQKGKIKAFEFKTGETKLSRGAKLFGKDYQLEINLINKENYLGFV